MEQYYFVENGHQNGPFSVSELKSKSLHGESLVWKEGMTGWEPAQNLPELRDMIFSTPPPIPNLSPPPLPIPGKSTPEKYPSGSNVRKVLIVILAFLIFLDAIVLFQDLGHHAYGEAFSLFIGMVVLLGILFFVARNKRYSSSSQKDRVIGDSPGNSGWAPPRPEGSDADIREIFGSRTGRVEASGIVDGGGNLSIQDKMGKVYLIDFRPTGDGKWMPGILAGDEISIVGRWQRKKYVLVNYVYNKSSHTKGESKNSRFSIFLLVVLAIIIIIALIAKSAKGG